MKTAKSKRAFWYAFITLALVVFGGNAITKTYRAIEKSIKLNAFKTALIESEAGARLLLDSLATNTFEQNKASFSKLEKEYLPKGISFYIYQGDSLKLWSNIEALPPFYFHEFYRPTYHQTDNGSYLFLVKSRNEMHCVVSINLVHHYLFSNKYLIDNSPLVKGFARNFKLGKPDEYEEKIQLGSGQVIASVSEKSIKSSSEFLSYLAFVFTIFMLLWVKRINSAQFALIVIVYVAARLLPEYSVFSNVALFYPSLYAGYFSCIADLLFALACLHVAIRQFYSLLKSKPFFYLFALLIPIAVNDLVLNSVITIDTSNTLELSLWSIISFVLVAWLLAMAIKIRSRFSSNTDLLYASITLAIVTALVFLLDQSWLILLYSPAFFMASYIAERSKNDSRKKLVFAVLISVIAFSQVEFLNHKKQKDKLPIMVKNLVNQRDNVAEFLLSDFRKNLLNDAYVNSFFANTLLPKSVVEERINKLYLRGYLKKFEHKILFAPKKIKFGISPDPTLANQINEILQNPTNEITEGIYNTKLTGIANSYLTEQHFTNNKNDTIGSLYILLNEKSFYDQSIYPELLIGQNKPLHDYEINFAYYKNSELVSSIGDIPYPVFVKNTTQKLEQQLSKNNKHYFYKPDNETVFIVSTKKRSWFNYTSSFSIFIFLIVLFSFCVLYGKKALFQLRQLNKAWHNASFSNRIRIATLGSVFLALVLLAYATNAYTQRKYEQKTRESLVKKATKAKLFFSSLFSNQTNIATNKDQLKEQVLQFSELYEADIDLFNENGVLLASSQQILYENGILEDQLDGTAFYEIALNGKSLFIRNEKIGELNYISAFVPVLLGTKVQGFVQLPYFKRQYDLRKDQANFVVTLFNIYLIILLLLAFITAIILRTVTRPLSLITVQLKNTSLTGNNQKIIWSKNDEIGLLVKEYNDMVDKLAHSAKQLAESKQAEAWQEMARQVAHEIKNPLTPMKLNIQQLQRAWNDEHPNLNKVFSKVTTVLINQIESLARIASNFSSFAKMPQIQKQPINIVAVLEELQQLYNAETTTVNIESAQNDVIINADKDQLFRALNNLVKNGIQAVEDDKTPIITITLHIDDQKVVISVADNGSGIDKSMKNKIFIPNFSTKSSGMGLGLAIVKQIVETHGGKISFESEAAKGTTFYIWLPIA